MSKVMAREFLRLKIRVNQIAPGIFPLEMTAEASDPDTHQSDLSGTGKGESLPAGRPGKEEDMAAATLYLASYAGVLWVPTWCLETDTCAVPTVRRCILMAGPWWRPLRRRRRVKRGEFVD